MKYCAFLLILCCAFFAMFNKKISLFKIFAAQVKVYKNDKTQKYSIVDIITFIVVPIIIGAVLGYTLPISSVSRYSNTVITIFTLIATVLLTFVTIIYDKDYNNSKKNEVIKQTIVTIITSVIYSMIIVALVVIPKIISLPQFAKMIILAIICTLIVKVAFAFMMILKRIFVIIN